MLIDTMDRLDGCETRGALWDCGLAAFAGCGSDWVTVGTALPNRLGVPLVETNMSADLMRDYLSARLNEADPWMHHCATTAGLDHLDVASGLRTAGSPMNTAILSVFEAHGVTGALLIPSYWGPRVGGIVAYARDKSEAKEFQNAENQSKLRLIAALFAQRYHPQDTGSDGGRRYQFHRTLAPREIEVLHWAITGLRTAQIAEKMGVQEVTVTKHFQSLRRKLGARTKEQAVAAAVQLGVLNL